MNVQAFIMEWNYDYPLDFWYRRKHNISFNSPAHRELSFIFILMEYLEDKQVQMSFSALKGKEEEEDVYIENSGDFLRQQVATEKDFEELDLSNFKF